MGRSVQAGRALGGTVECGSLLLNLLELDGWDVQRVGAFAGEGILVIARGGPGRGL